MIAARLLAALRRRGFAVRLDGGRVLIAPASQLTPGDVAEIGEYRGELLALLAAEVPPAEWTDADRYLLRMLAAGAWDWGESKGWRW